MPPPPPQPEVTESAAEAERNEPRRERRDECNHPPVHASSREETPSTAARKQGAAPHRFELVGLVASWHRAPLNPGRQSQPPSKRHLPLPEQFPSFRQWRSFHGGVGKETFSLSFASKTT